MKKYILFIIFVFCFASFSFAQVSVIVNKSVSDKVDKGKLKNIYTLKTQKWTDGTKIIVFDSKESGTSEKVYKEIGKSGSQLNKEWLRAQLTGEGKAPKKLKSDKEILEKVASTPGAIGYVSSSSVTDDVKVVLKL